VYGYGIVVAYLAACALVAPAQWGHSGGLLIGAAYLIFVWFFGGLYLADVLHLGIAHRSVDFKPWFVKSVTVFTNTFGIYVGPVAWVNRHRLHHRHADHAGDPNKLSSDGFWKTLYLCVFPYECKENVAQDAILQSRTFRLVESPWFAVTAQALSFGLLWILTGSLAFAVVLWTGVRLFALWVNMIQNYWTHTRTYGYRRYEGDEDNAMNIGEWFPVTATFSACLQNNHHHNAGFARLSHDESEYDFGFLTVKAMMLLGLAQLTRTGSVVPKDAALTSLGL
jgi:fatty-acid desaturase